GIQAMDLVARKMADGGEAAQALIDEMQAVAEEARARNGDLGDPVWQATESLREATEWLVAQKDLNVRFAGAVPFLSAFARVLGGHYHLKAAMEEAEDGPRTKLARFYINRLLPEHVGLLAQSMVGSTDLYALRPEEMYA
ncbi:MAG: acyl-CoA dehydrogenase C-terminal domain-containing protein, partial [Pseudooceanicola nanhaiensis]